MVRLLDALVRLAAIARRREDQQAIADVSRTAWATTTREVEDESQRSRLADRYARVRHRINAGNLRKIRSLSFSPGAAAFLAVRHFFLRCCSPDDESGVRVFIRRLGTCSVVH